MLKCRHEVFCGSTVCCSGCDRRLKVCVLHMGTAFTVVLVLEVHEKKHWSLLPAVFLRGVTVLVLD